MSCLRTNFCLAVLTAAVVIFSFVTAVLAQEDSIMLQNLHRMRIKQQDQESVIRAQIFKTVRQEGECTPVQQTRQRMRELKGNHNDDIDDENIVINAGHEQFNVTDNHGTINSDVNVQILKQGRDNPCP
jgi:hypothetical protein